MYNIFEVRKVIFIWC